MRPRLIAGNWKMHKTVSESKSFVHALLQRLPKTPQLEVAIAPPFTALQTIVDLLDSSSLKLAAQNVSSKNEGAYTGEISPIMLKDLGCHYVIIGHSERRLLFGEKNDVINQKVQGALHHRLHPIVCVGELLEERESGQTETVIETQTIACLEGISKEQIPNITIAYEPVWAIGTGRAASVKQAAEVHALIRSTISQKWGIEDHNIRVLYGGSVSPDNAKDLFQSPQINGALVGKACLEVDSFVKIISLASDASSS